MSLQQRLKSNQKSAIFQHLKKLLLTLKPQQIIIKNMVLLNQKAIRILFIAQMSLVSFFNEIKSVRNLQFQGTHSEFYQSLEKETPWKANFFARRL